ncbi:hypothetical protein [Mycolicibacterium sp. CR10]|uniref:hypothetical protein n=1 Tax=Mycolicibacterium sp. CR10 TaxID=2562314 RepID=UPI0010C0A090|nr:hypothetical protein [Mycolicibacterium sp. CR10]
MASSSRIKIAVLGALVAGGALAAAGQAGAQPVPVDPALPPVPGAAAPVPGAAPAPNQVFTYTPIAEAPAPGSPGAIPSQAPAPPPIGAPYIPPVQGGDFNNTGQLSYLRELWNMRNPQDFFGAMAPTGNEPGMGRPMPMLPPGEYPPGVVSPAAPAGAPAAPAPAPPPVWPPAGMVPIATP